MADACTAVRSQQPPVPKPATNSRQRLLDPMDRMAEVLCGLIMVMTFTLAIKRDGWTVHEALVSAIGCNLAWGIIDGSLYAIGCLSERGRNLRALHVIHTGGQEEGRRVISAHLPPLIASVLTADDFERLREQLAALPELSPRESVTKEALLGGVGVFLLVFLSTFPVVIPFLVVKNLSLALPISNGVALVLLFLTGFFYGRTTESGAWRAGFFTLAIGGVLTIIALVLGG